MALLESLPPALRGARLNVPPPLKAKLGQCLNCRIPPSTFLASHPLFCGGGQGPSSRSPLAATPLEGLQGKGGSEGVGHCLPPCSNPWWTDSLGGLPAQDTNPLRPFQDLALTKLSVSSL